MKRRVVLKEIIGILQALIFTAFQNVSGRSFAVKSPFFAAVKGSGKQPVFVNMQRACSTYAAKFTALKNTKYRRCFP